MVPIAGIWAFPIAAAGQVPAHYIAINVPDGVRSESIFIRYILAGEELGGWVQARSGINSYIIDTTHGGQSATRIKAILYAPGCAIQTLDIPLSDSNNPEYSFMCRPLASVWIGGRLTQTERLYGRDVKLRAKYIARWAQPFLGLGAEIPVTIPAGDVAYLAADGSFRIWVPDFSRDPLAGAPDHAGELQIWALDKAGEDAVAQLVPAGPQAGRTRTGGLKVQRAYPSETSFAPCTVNPDRLQQHDREGFALRPAPYDVCDR
jgi:hypothetical protein